MSNDRPSIAELQKLEQQMESAPWDRTTPHAVSNAEYDLGRFDSPADAVGVVALRNAAPVLLEIAKTALEWAESDDEDRQAELDALLAALVKVRP